MDLLIVDALGFAFSCRMNCSRIAYPFLRFVVAAVGGRSLNRRLRSLSEAGGFRRTIIFGIALFL